MYFYHLEPVKLVGPGEYNINVLKQVEVSESYLGLPYHVTGCQSKESLYNCTTKKYKEVYLQQCGCLPFTIIKSDKVVKMYV